MIVELWNKPILPKYDIVNQSLKRIVIYYGPVHAIVCWGVYDQIVPIRLEYGSLNLFYYLFLPVLLMIALLTYFLVYGCIVLVEKMITRSNP